ncbi:hypothetical protein CEXT_176531 [Caerostris extrusa]|uniref:Uncharacterized protein n=1 Tax=Caerostris extrusa TaxID=172846 RepID=A0AAV4UAB4_CAEEX|nr:hypothetical protein CEXT_176531 [Caerostris extrusa]
MKEILNITDPEMLNTEKYNFQTTSTEKPVTEQYITSSFLADLFEINTAPSILTEDVADNKPVIGDTHNETEEKLWIFIHNNTRNIFELSFVEDIKNGTNKSYKHIPNNVSLFSEIRTSAPDIDTEFITYTKMNNLLELFTKDISSYETAIANENFVNEIMNSSQIPDYNLH